MQRGIASPGWSFPEPWFPPERDDESRTCDSDEDDEEGDPDGDYEAREIMEKQGI